MVVEHCYNTLCNGNPISRLYRTSELMTGYEEPGDGISIQTLLDDSIETQLPDPHPAQYIRA